MFSSMLSGGALQLLSLFVVLTVLTSMTAGAAPLEGGMNPVMRSYYTRNDLNRQPYGTLPGRTMRSAMRARNCFFSPDESAAIRRRRRLFTESGGEFPVGSRFRRNFQANGGWNNGLYF
ncbi:hypothetical protein M3Y99_01295000 [Aphelenchoides fujianensis]|nr:hypothetical protein M3Y99_01295000 [Aphelenchoides fujianensis]